MVKLYKNKFGLGNHWADTQLHSYTILLRWFLLWALRSYSFCGDSFFLVFLWPLAGNKNIWSPNYMYIFLPAICFVYHECKEDERVCRGWLIFIYPLVQVPVRHAQFFCGFTAAQLHNHTPTPGSIPVALIVLFRHFQKDSIRHKYICSEIFVQFM